VVDLPPLSERIWASPPPEALICSVCQEVFTDVRATARRCMACDLCDARRRDMAQLTCKATFTTAADIAAVRAHLLRRLPGPLADCARSLVPRGSLPEQRGRAVRAIAYVSAAAAPALRTRVL
jgi:hypothetical protein